jgi:hypothetical protein
MRELWRLESVQTLREAAIRATVPDDVGVTAYLDNQQRKQLRREIGEVEKEIARMCREYRRRYLHNGQGARSRKNHFEAYEELVSGLREDKRHMEARLAAADAFDSVARSVPPSIDANLSDALREVLTEDPPEDDAACRRRAAVFGRIVTKVVVDKTAEGGFTVEIYGPLIPEDLPLLEVPRPSEFTAETLAAHKADRHRATGAAPITRSTFGDARPALTTRPDLQVSSELSPSDESCKSKRYAWRLSIAA